MVLVLVLFALERGLLLGDECGYTLTIIVGLQIVEIRVDLGCRQRRRALREAADNSLCQRATSGAPSAMRRAVAYASRSTAASGTTRVSNPFAYASSAFHTRPSSRISAATARPASASRPASSEYAIAKPSRLIGTPKRPDSPAMRKSQLHA